MKFGGVEISATELDIICKTTVCVFEIIERAWASVDCALIDMKIEFGVDIEKRERIFPFVFCITVSLFSRLFYKKSALAAF